MKVYHASKYTIKSPDVKHSRDLLDFGKGFYLTSLVEQAKKYAQRFLFQGEKANEYARIVPIFAKQIGITLDEALDFFYNSCVYQMMSKGIADMHCRSDGYLAELLKEEWEKKSKIA